MSYKNSVTFFSVFKFWVVISWAFSWADYVVVGPLACKWESEHVAKEIFVQLVGGDALAGEEGGRTAPSKTRTFDSTMGFPGEDVAKQPSH